MTNLKQLNKAEIFIQLHYGQTPLILPNAWDVLSAKLFAKSGAKAIGTTSAGIAASLGFSDGQKVPKEVFLSITDQIVNAVDVPVTVDIEAGYGYDLSSICDTVKKVIDMGGAGINIEDSIFDPYIKLEGASAQCKKISAIKSTCENSCYINNIGKKENESPQKSVDLICKLLIKDSPIFYGSLLFYKDLKYCHLFHALYQNLNGLTDVVAASVKQ